MPAEKKATLVYKGHGRTVRVSRRKLPKHIVAKQNAARDRENQAAELRRAGATFAEIAKALGYAHPSAAKKAVDRVQNRTVMETAKELVLMDLQRLDEYQARCTQILRSKNDLNQIDRLLRIMEARYRLAGVGSRTVEELQEAMGISGKAVGIENKGVMIITGSETDFVRSMMEANGVDPNSPAARRHLLELEAGDPKAKNRTVKKKKTPTPPPSPDAQVVAGDESYGEIIDAEIVEDEI